MTNKQAFLGINNKKINAELNLLKKKKRACLSFSTTNYETFVRVHKIFWLVVRGLFDYYYKFHKEI